MSQKAGKQYAWELITSLVTTADGPIVYDEPLNPAAQGTFYVPYEAVVSAAVRTETNSAIRDRM